MRIRSLVRLHTSTQYHDIVVYNVVESNYNKNKLSNPCLSVNLTLILLHVRHRAKDMGSLTYTLTTQAQSLRGPISHFSHILNTYNTCQGAVWAKNMAFRNVCKIGRLRKE